MVREFFKRRYIVLEVVTKHRLEKLSILNKDLQRIIEDAVQKCHGVVGLGQVINRLKVKYLDSQTKTCIIRVPRRAAKLVLDSLHYVKRVGSLDGSFRVLTVSGTLRGCQKWLRTYHFESLPKLIEEVMKDGKADVSTAVNHIKLSAEIADSKLTELEIAKNF